MKKTLPKIMTPKKLKAYHAKNISTICSGPCQNPITLGTIYFTRIPYVPAHDKVKTRLECFRCYYRESRPIQEMKA